MHWCIVLAKNRVIWPKIHLFFSKLSFSNLEQIDCLVCSLAIRNKFWIIGSHIRNQYSIVFTFTCLLGLDELQGFYWWIWCLVLVSELRMQVSSSLWHSWWDFSYFKLWRRLEQISSSTFDYCQHFWNHF